MATLPRPQTLDNRPALLIFYRRAAREFTLGLLEERTTHVIGKWKDKESHVKWLARATQTDVFFAEDAFNTAESHGTCIMRIYERRNMSANHVTPEEAEKWAVKKMFEGSPDNEETGDGTVTLITPLSTNANVKG